VGARESAKGQLHGLRVGFIGRGWREGGDGRSNDHQWPRGAGGFKIAFKGILIRETEGEIDGGGVKPGF
jgi:hypothetical protein